MARKPISKKSAKAKGRNLQNHVRDGLREAFDLSVDDVRGCPMGSTGADIALSEAAQDRIPFQFECKARSKIALLYDALAQANRVAGPVPVAVVKADRKRPLVVMDWDDFLTLIRP